MCKYCFSFQVHTFTCSLLYGSVLLLWFLCLTNLCFVDQVEDFSEDPDLHNDQENELIKVLHGGRICYH